MWFTRTAWVSETIGKTVEPEVGHSVVCFRVTVEVFSCAQVFQECGTPHPVQSRNRRAPASREEASRSWRASAEEERPTTAAGTNLHRLVRREAKLLRVLGVCQEVLCSFVCYRAGMGAPRET